MNKKIKLFSLTFTLLFSLNFIKAQSSIEEITSHFFKTYEAEPQKAIDYIFGTNSWMVERNKDGIDNVKSQLRNLLGLVGKYYGHEKITEKSIGESYKLISYLVKYDRQPVRFTFVFYKPNKKWQAQSFQFDDNLDDEIEESGKVYRLKENWK